MNLFSHTLTAISRRSFVAALLLAGFLLPQAASAQPASAEGCKYFIEISVNGLGSVYLQPMIEKKRVAKLPSFSDRRGMDKQCPQ